MGAAIPKILARRHFREAVRRYEIVPAPAVGLASITVPIAEFVLGSMLLIGIVTTAVAYAVAAMLGVFAGAVAINLLRGRRFDCGCFATASPRLIGWRVVGEDVVLAAMATYAGIRPPSTLAVTESGYSTLTTGDALAVIVIVCAAFIGRHLVEEAIRVDRAKKTQGGLAT